MQAHYYNSTLWSVFHNISEQKSFKSEKLSSIHFSGSSSEFVGGVEGPVAGLFEGGLRRLSSRYHFCIITDGKARLHIDDVKYLDVPKTHVNSTKLHEECAYSVETPNDPIKIKVEYLRSNLMSSKSSLILMFRPRWGQHYFSIPHGYDWGDAVSAVIHYSSCFAFIVLIFEYYFN